MAFPQIAARPPLPRPGLLKGDNLVAGVLGLVALGLAVLIAHDVFFPPAAPVAALSTTTVAMGTVRSAVTGTGTLVPAAQQTLGFRSGGTLTEVDVRVGDQVKAGQVLAKIDPAPLQLALTQAQASLASAQANLSNTLNGTSLTQALHQLQQAQQNYTDTLNQVGQTNANDQNTVNGDQNTVNSDQAQLSSDQAAFWYQQFQSTQQGLQTALNNDTATFHANNCTIPPSPGTCTSALNAMTAAQQDLNTLSNGPAQVLQTSPYSTNYTATQVGFMTSAFKAVGADQARLGVDQSKLSADQSKQALDQQQGQRTINQAANSITSAQDAYNGQAVNRPATLQQEQAAVASAQAQVSTAQSNLDGATLTAPIDGVISSVAGQVGDVVGASTGASGAQAPGSTAPLPSSGASSSTGATGSTASGGGSGFMTLMNNKAFQAVVSFAESDATNIKSTQSGTVTFDAIPNLTVPVHVLAVAAAPNVSSNVVNYYVTLTLDSLDSRLRSGLTANASVVTASVSNVITVPNRAITRLGGASFVNVLQGGRQARVRVQPGVVGDSTTEIVSGLNPGDKVILPQLRVTATPGAARGLGGGGGGIRFGGGGG